MSTSPDNRYLVGGIAVSSELPLPGLIETDAVPDVSIRLATGPLSLPEPTIRGLLFVADDTACLINAPGVARYLIQDGRLIMVEPIAGAAPEAVRLFLLGAALGMVLCQRGLLVWHASAVAGPHGEAVVLAGHSGRGKSTMTGALLQRGCRLLTDDLTVVSRDGSGRPLVHPTFPRLKLLPDAALRLGLDVGSLARVRPGARKVFVPADGRFVQTPLPIGRIYVLDYSSPRDVGIRAITGHERFERLRPYLFGQKYVEHRRIHLRQFAAFTAALSAAPVRLLSRPVDAAVDAVADTLFADLAS
jgi:hypothetical protein